MFWLRLPDPIRPKSFASANERYEVRKWYQEHNNAIEKGTNRASCPLIKLNKEI